MDSRAGIADDLLAAGDEHFRIALHAERVIFWAAAADGGCELVSANWSALTGQVAATRGEGWLDAVAADDRDLVADTVRQAVTEHCGFYLRYRLRAGDGGARWVLHDASPRFLPSGKFNGLIGTLSDCADLEAGEQALATTAQRIYAFVNGLPLASVSIDLEGRIVHCNAAIAARLGHDAAALVGRNWIGEWIADSDRTRARRLVNGDIPPSELPAEFECLILATGGERLYRWHLTLLRDFAGRPLSLTWMGNDITQWRRIGDNARLAARVFDTTNEAMLVSDRDNNIVSVNEAFTRLTGYAADEVIGRNPRVLKSPRHPADFYAKMWQQLLAEGFWRGDIWDRRKDGSVYPKYLSLSVIRDANGAVTHYSAIFHDASDRKALEERLDRLAHYDELTELPNRTLLQDRLEQAIAGAERRQEMFALLFVDLDDFKAINDGYGHATGDALLKLVGQRLRGAIRSVDTAARLGGDEFVVVLTDIQSPVSAAAVGEKIAEAIAEPCPLPAATLTVSASIGISLYPSDERAAGELLRRADEAMYRAKQAGKQRVFFSARTS